MTSPLDKDRILDLWAAGLGSHEIADAIGTIQFRRIQEIVLYARTRGDPRAVHHAAKGVKRGPYRGHPAEKNAVDWLRKPDTSNLTLTGRLFGDPAAGRSALDQKRAAQR